MTSIPYSKQTISKHDISSVVNVLRSDWLTQGPMVEKFEKDVAVYVGAKYAVAFSNGTTALHGAYFAAGIGKEDEILTSANTFAATSNAALLLGAIPKFVDISLDTYNMDTSLIEKKIAKKTKAIVPVHFGGHPCNMDTIFSLAKKHKLIIIEDAAHALGALYKNKRIGGLHSHMSVLSFHPVKTITTGEGGMVVTNSLVFANKLRLFRSHGITKDKFGINRMYLLGNNYRLPDILCALGISQLKQINQFIKKRSSIALLYNKLLYECDDIILPVEKEYTRSSWHLYVIRVKNPKKRMKLCTYLKESGIQTNFHYPPVYTHPYYQKIGYKNYNCPNAELYFSGCLSLPIYPTLKKTEVSMICEKIYSFFKNKK